MMAETVEDTWERIKAEPAPYHCPKHSPPEFECWHTCSGACSKEIYTLSTDGVTCADILERELNLEGCGPYTKESPMLRFRPDVFRALVSRAMKESGNGFRQWWKRRALRKRLTAMGLI